MRPTTAVLVISLLGGSVTTAAALDPATAISDYVHVAWSDQTDATRIAAITQDRDGYLWLATDSGLVRFDGVRFVSWQDLGRSALPNTRPGMLLSSRTGDLWIGYDGAIGGVTRVHEGRSVNYAMADGLPRNCLALIEDRNGAIWTGGYGGVSRFHNGRWERMEGRDGLPTVTIIGLFEDRHGNLWVGTESLGLFVRKIGDTRFRPATPALRVRNFTEDADGALWVTGPEIGLERLGASNRAPEPLKALNGNALLRDRHGTIWVGTRDGLWRIRVVRGSPAAERVSDAQKLTSNAVLSLFEDREGNLWVGTEAGLDRLSEASIVTMLKDEEVSRAAPTAALATGDGLWLGTENGLYRFASNGRQRYGRSDGLSTGVVTALHADVDGRLWVGTRATLVRSQTDPPGLARFENGKFVRMGLPVHLPLIYTITSDSEGAVWFSDVTQGLHEWRDGTVRPLGVPAHLDGTVSMSSLADRRGRVWLGFNTGTVLVHDRGTFRSYATDDGLAGGGIGSIFEDSSGDVWIGSEGGLSRFAEQRFVSATTRNGLPGEVRSIVEDDRGGLWFGTDAGIVKMQKSEMGGVARDASYRIRYDIYDIADGLGGRPTVRRGYPNAARASNGTLWFVTSTGVAVVYPDRVRKDPPPPLVHVERVLANGRYLDPASHLELPPLSSNLEIEYTALSFAAATKLRFRYRLEGLDEEWVDAGSRRNAFYTNLGPGDYRFRVSASNGGPWTDAATPLTFSIQPTFFQTTWFYAACVSAFGFAVVAAWQLRLRRVKRDCELVLAERTRVARELHDTLLQSLCGVSLKLDDLANCASASSETIKLQLERLRRNVELNIREARHTIRGLRSPVIRTGDLAEVLREYGEHITAGTPVQFEVTVEGSPRRLQQVDEALLRVGQEAIINAVRHARATRVQLALRYGPDSVVLRALDDGCGFGSDAPEAGAVQHWGMTIMRERAEGIGGQFRVHSTPASGTEVEVVAPLTPGPAERAS